MLSTFSNKSNLNINIVQSLLRMNNFYSNLLPKTKVSTKNMKVLTFKFQLKFKEIRDIEGAADLSLHFEALLIVFDSCNRLADHHSPQFLILFLTKL